MTLSFALDAASWIFFALGSFFLLAGSIGMIRLPDFWSRLHAAGVIDTLGIELFVLGMLCQAGLTFVSIKLLLIGAFVFLTSPTGTHAVANAAYVAGLRPLGMSPPGKAPPARKAGDAAKGE